MRKAIIGVLLIVLLAAPTAVAESGGWHALTERLGLVESANVEQNDRLARLEEQAAGQSLMILRLKSRLACVEQALRGHGKCRTTTLRRP